MEMERGYTNSYIHVTDKWLEAKKVTWDYQRVLCINDIKVQWFTLNRII